MSLLAPDRSTEGTGDGTVASSSTTGPAAALILSTVTAASGLFGAPPIGLPDRITHSAMRTESWVADGPTTHTSPLTWISVLTLDADPAAAAAVRSDRDEVVWVKERSGLTWDQLGRALGVSRRAVHLWANGGRMNETNARLLRELSKVVKQAQRSNVDETRAALLTVGADGLSVIDRLKAAHHRTGDRDITGPALRPAQLLGGPVTEDI